MIVEILKKSKLRTLGLWEDNVSSITGDIHDRFSTDLSMVSEKGDSQLSIAVSVDQFRWERSNPDIDNCGAFESSPVPTQKD